MCLGVGECSMGRCFAGMGNCDGNNCNGCETDLMTDPNQCGACGIRCLSGSCKRGFCMGSAIIGVDVGALHACVALPSGRVACWGNNTSGQLGDGTITNRSQPVVVLSLDDAVEVSAGAPSTCARRASGAVVCLGANDSGQLGDNTMTMRLAPTMVSGITNAASLGAGDQHACARSAVLLGSQRRRSARQRRDGAPVARASPRARLLSARERCLAQIAVAQTWSVFHWPRANRTAMKIVSSSA
jgi:hypothetical protein